LEKPEHYLFQGDDEKRSKQQFIDLFSSFPNYVAFSFGHLQLFCEISCQLARNQAKSPLLAAWDL
jgi:hypothetical protein